MSAAFDMASVEGREEPVATANTGNASSVRAAYRPMTRDEANVFISENKSLIHAVLRSYKGCDEYDDLFQIASIGFYKGIMSYNPALRVKMTTYCYECAKNEVKMHLRKNSAKSRSAAVVSLDSLQDPDTGRSENWLERNLAENDTFHPATEDIGDTIGNKEVFDAAMKIIQDEMSWEEQLVLQRFMSGQPQSVTAKELGASQAKVSKIQKIAIAKLTLAMKERNLGPAAS